MAEPKVETEVTAPVSDRDAVNNDVRDAIASLKGDADVPDAISGDKTQVADTPEKAAAAAAAEDARPRGADGKFLPKDKAEAAPVTAAPDKLPATDNLAKASATASKPFAPPAGWAADGRQAWAALETALPTLPPAVQAALGAIHAAATKRDEAANVGFAQYSEKTKAYERALAPIAQEAQQFGLNVENGIKRLLDGHRFLEQQPAQAILWLAQKHGLNLAELATNPPAPQPQRSEVAIPPQFLQEVSGLKEQLNGILMDQNMSAVQQFAEKNTLYADVEDQLPDLMRELSVANPALRGVPLLQAAYDRAIWLNPDVRTKLIAEQQAQTTQAATAKVAEKAAKAGKAAVSIKGSSADTRPPPKANGAGDSVYDAVRESINQLRSA